MHCDEAIVRKHCTLLMFCRLKVVHSEKRTDIFDGWSLAVRYESKQGCGGLPIPVHYQQSHPKIVFMLESVWGG